MFETVNTSRQLGSLETDHCPLHSLSISAIQKQNSLILARPLASQLVSKLHGLAPTRASPCDHVGQWDGITHDVSSQPLQDEATWWGFLVPASEWKVTLDIQEAAAS